MRRSGRTKRMLLEAAIAVSEKKNVLIIGHTADYTRQLVDELRSMCVRLQIPFEENQFRGRSAQDPRLEHESEMEILVDHYAQELGFFR